MEYFIYNQQKYYFSEKEFLGYGGNWDVFSLRLQKQIIIQNNYYQNVVLKEPKNRIGSLSDYISKHNTLISKGIPTVNFMIECFYNNKNVIITENLLNRELLYVTSNYRPTKSNDIVLELLINKQIITNQSEDNKSKNLSTDASLDNIINQIKNSDSYEEMINKQKHCISEEKLYNNKLSQISNKQILQEKLEQLSILCANNKIFFPEDSIFFGVNLEKESIDDIILADLDTVSINSENNIKKNKQSAKIALEEFIAKFVQK